MILTSSGKLLETNNHPPWFEDDKHAFLACEKNGIGYCKLCCTYISHNLTEAAESSGVEVEQLRANFSSDDPKKLWMAYRVIAEYYGWVEFDQYPRILT